MQSTKGGLMKIKVMFGVVANDFSLNISINQSMCISSDLIKQTVSAVVETQLLCFLIEDVQLVKRKCRSRPIEATRPILPNDSIPRVSGQSIPLGQLGLLLNL